MTTNYDVWVVSPDFFSPGANINYYSGIITDRDFLVSTEQVRRDIMGNGTIGFERLDALSCIKAYGEILSNKYTSLVIVSRNKSDNPDTDIGSVLYRQAYSPYDTGLIETLGLSPFEWICEGDDSTFDEVNKGRDSYLPCYAYLHRIEANADDWRPFGYVFDYCLAEPIEQQCTFNGIVHIPEAVIACNVVKVLIMLIVAIRLTASPCITIGDALESFLKQPDQYTRDLCLFNQFDARQSHSLANHQRVGGTIWQYTNGEKPRPASLAPMRWNKSASRLRWVQTIGFILLALFAVAAFLGVAVDLTKSYYTLSQLGFGKVQPLTVLAYWDIKTITQSILVANVPQVILSFLYLNLNGLFTSMWTAQEWSKFATERKPLRVSTRKGQQRSKHFLQLPYRIAIPLMVVSGLLHWLLSQSIFLAVVASYNELGELIDPLAIATCGFSPLPMIIVLVLGSLTIIGTLLIGWFRKYDPSMPLAGSCSVAISAACHRPEWDIAAHLAPVKWGVVPGSEDENGVGHCCFTSGELEAVESGKLYAGGGGGGGGGGKRRPS